MSGRTDLVFWILVGLAATGAGWDLLRRRIPNILTFGAMATGFAYHVGTLGSEGALLSFLGVATGFVALGWMFFLGWMGAGDVKFLMAFGAWMGPRATVQVTLLSIVIGGVMALLQIGFQRDARKRLTKVWRFFQSIFIKELKLEVPLVDQRLRMPFGVAIAAAAVLVERGFEIWRMLGLKSF